MNSNPSPLEYLASFTITFFAGVVTMVELGAGFKWVRGDGHMASRKN